MPKKEIEQPKIQYLESGTVDEVEAEETHRGKKANYDIEAIATALTSGKKYVLPSIIERVNVIYEIEEKLKAKGIKNVDYGSVKGTVQTHTKKSKNGKEYTVTTAQYFLFVVS